LTKLGCRAVSRLPDACTRVVLCAQLTNLSREKHALELELRHEHEEHALAMQRLGAAFSEKLTERARLKDEKVVLENQLEAEQELIVHRMTAQVQALLVERSRLKRDNDRLRAELRGLGRAPSASPAVSPRSTPASSPRAGFARSGADLMPPPHQLS
jgi:hypothetical protein